MADLIEHSPLGGPADAVHPGDQIDCEPCRAALLAAFREPADSDYPPLNSPVPPYKDGGLPHLFPPPPETPSWTGEHVTWQRVDPFTDGPGGTWAVGCECGWGESGGYARDGMGEQTARRLATLKAQRHREDPAAPAPDGRPHLMVPPDHTRTVDLNPVHTALTDPGHPGSGMWSASCSCGWAVGGRWGDDTSDIHDFTHARLKAEAEANAHLNEEHK